VTVEAIYATITETSDALAGINRSRGERGKGKLAKRVKGERGNGEEVKRFTPFPFYPVNLFCLIS